MARPKLPQSRKRRKRVNVQLTDREFRALRNAAGERSLSDYIRDLLRAALNIREEN